MKKITKLNCKWVPKAIEYDKIFNSIKNRFSDKGITFVEVDESSDEYEELMSIHNILGIPCLIIEQDDKETIYLEGNQSLANLEEFINNLLEIGSKYLATSISKCPRIKAGIYNVVWIDNCVEIEDKKNNLLFYIPLDREAPSAIYPCKMEVFEDGSIKILK